MRRKYMMLYESFGSNPKTIHQHRGRYFLGLDHLDGFTSLVLSETKPLVEGFQSEMATMSLISFRV